MRLNRKSVSNIFTINQQYKYLLLFLCCFLFYTEKTAASVDSLNSLNVKCFESEEFFSDFSIFINQNKEIRNIVEDIGEQKTLLTKLLDDNMQKGSACMRYFLMPKVILQAVSDRDWGKVRRYLPHLCDTVKKYKVEDIHGSYFMAFARDAEPVCYMVQGIMALEEENIKLADEYLNKLGDIYSTSRYLYVRPYFDLAYALLQKGEVTPVLCFLKKIRTNWVAGTLRVNQWIKALENNQYDFDMPALFYP